MRSGSKKYERDLLEFQRELAKKPRRVRKQKSRDDQQAAGSKPRLAKPRHAPRWTPPASRTAIVSSRPVTREGVTFHFAHTTVRRDQDGATRATRHQQYIERPGAAETIAGVVGRDIEIEPAIGYGAEGRPGRFAQSYMEGGNVEFLAGRPLSFGNIGDTPEQRDEFWRLVELTAPKNGIVQHRIICELPHELGPAAHLQIVQEFSKVFFERGLPFWVVVHAPDSRNDSRNYHCHIVYHHRPAKRLDSGVWDFAYSVEASNKYGNRWRRFPHRQPVDRRVCQTATKKVDDGKTVKVPSWYEELRARYCATMNDALVRAGATKRYTHKSYRALGVTKRPTEHLGPKRAARERAGLQTGPGAENSSREIEYAATQVATARFAGWFQVDAFIAQAEKLRINPIPPSALPAVIAAEQAMERYRLQAEAFLDVTGRAVAFDTYERRRDAILAAEIEDMRRGASKIEPAQISRHHTILRNQRLELAPAVDVAKINAEARQSLDTHARALAAERSRLGQILFDAEQALEGATEFELSPVALTEVPTLSPSQIRVQAPVTPAAPPPPAQRPTASARPPATVTSPALPAQPTSVPAGSIRSDAPKRPDPAPAASLSLPNPPAALAPAQLPAAPASTTTSGPTSLTVPVTAPAPNASAVAPAPSQPVSIPATFASVAPVAPIPAAPIAATAPASPPAMIPTDAPVSEHRRPVAPPSVAIVTVAPQPQPGTPVTQQPPAAASVPVTPRAIAIEIPKASPERPAAVQPAIASPAAPMLATRVASAPMPPVPQPTAEAQKPATSAPAATLPTAAQAQPAIRPAVAKPPIAERAITEPLATRPTVPAKPAAPIAAPTAAPARPAAPKVPAPSSPRAAPEYPNGIRAAAARQIIKLPRDQYPNYVTIYSDSALLPRYQQQTFGRLFTTDVERLKVQYHDTIKVLHHVHAMKLPPEQEPWRPKIVQMLRNGVTAIQHVAALNGWWPNADPAQWREHVYSDLQLSAPGWHFRFTGGFAGLPRGIQQFALARRADIAKRLGQPIPGPAKLARPDTPTVRPAVPPAPRQRPDRTR